MRKFYIKYLKNLLVFYENLKKQSNAHDLLMISDTILAIEKELYWFTQKYFDKTPSILFRFQTFLIETQGLKEVFELYALQHLFLGKFPTFSKIQAQKEVWDCGIFLIFCRHFQIHSENPKIPSLTKAQLIEIYKQNSLYCSQMNFEMFLRAFDDIAVRFYNAQYDENSVLKVSHFSQSKKRILLLEYLRIGDLNNLKQKIKQFNIRNRPTASNIKISLTKINKPDTSKEPLKKLKIFKLFNLEKKENILSRHQSISYRKKTSVTRVSSAIQLRSSHEKALSYDNSCSVDRKIS